MIRGRVSKVKEKRDQVRWESRSLVWIDVNRDREGHVRKSDVETDILDSIDD